VDPLTTFLLAMLNVRLGYWLPRPDSVAGMLRWRVPVGPVYFLAELFGLPRRFQRCYVNVSDGGHIENLGIFELLRRRCGYIIAIDAEADPDMTFNGLAIVQRLAKTDLDIDIHFDIEDLRKDADGLSRRHFALCRIDYGPRRGGGRDYGQLLYVKSSLVGSEIEYLKEYRARRPRFPHESTGDQFFNEAQFEAYRRLGYKMGRELVESQDAQQHAEAYAPQPQPPATAADLFAEIRSWLRPAAPFLDNFVRLQEQREAIDLRLAKDEFARYRMELLDGLGLEGATPSGLGKWATAFANPTPSEPTNQRARRGNGDAGPMLKPDFLAEEARHLQLVNQQMQLMERAVLDLSLNERVNQIHPRNRGWMNLFRAWSQAPTFQKYWALNIAYYSDALEIFSYYALGLKLGIKWRWRPAWDELSRAERRLLWHVLLPEIQRPELKWPPEGLLPDELGLALAMPVERWEIEPTPHSTETPIALALLKGRTNGRHELQAFRVRDTYRCLRLCEQLLVDLQQKLDAPIHYPFGPQASDLDREYARIAAHIEACFGRRHARAGWNTNLTATELGRSPAAESGG
jgi:hypothetical protein